MLNIIQTKQHKNPQNSPMEETLGQNDQLNQTVLSATKLNWYQINLNPV